jgi:Fe2+ or Zn2+ uptake regulation protein
MEIVLHKSKFRIVLNVMKTSKDILREAGISPSAQRVAIAEFVLHTGSHPSADEVFLEAKKRLPSISVATIYNTLHLFVEHGLLRTLELSHNHTVYDPCMDAHHHFIDDQTGRIHDVPLDAVSVTHKDFDGFDIREVQVVLRGRSTPPKQSA